ncbi:MAG: hypothetical protein AAGJ83_07190, partial [Planctomycetota bacterium]
DVNVRDLERWCGVSASEGATRASLAVFGPRCRDERQRDALADVLRTVSEGTEGLCHQADVDATPDYVRAGAVVLSRRRCFFDPELDGAPTFDDDDDESVGSLAPRAAQRVRIDTLALEACTRALRLRWPLLLVGDATGDLATFMAHAVGATLWRIQLSPATDVADLLGGYEQVDDERLKKRADARLRAAVTSATRVALRTAATNDAKAENTPSTGVLQTHRDSPRFRGVGNVGGLHGPSHPSRIGWVPPYDRVGSIESAGVPAMPSVRHEGSYGRGATAYNSLVRRPPGGRCWRGRFRSASRRMLGSDGNAR